MFTVITVRNNAPLPYGFESKSDALDFYDAQVSEGWIYTTLWEHGDDGIFHPLDVEAVRKNLHKSGVWL